MNFLDGLALPAEGQKIPPEAANQGPSNDIDRLPTLRG